MYSTVDIILVWVIPFHEIKTCGSAVRKNRSARERKSQDEPDINRNSCTGAFAAPFLFGAIPVITGDKAFGGSESVGQSSSPVFSFWAVAGSQPLTLSRSDAPTPINSDESRAGRERATSSFRRGPTLDAAPNSDKSRAGAFGVQNDDNSRTAVSLRRLFAGFPVSSKPKTDLELWTGASGYCHQGRAALPRRPNFCRKEKSGIVPGWAQGPSTCRQEN